SRSGRRPVSDWMISNRRNIKRALQALDLRQRESGMAADPAADIVLVGDTHSMVMGPNGTFVHRVLSPLQEALVDTEYSSRMLVRGQKRIESRSDCVVELQPLLDRRAMMQIIRSRQNINLQGYRAAMEILERFGYSRSLLTESQMRMRIRWVLDWARLAERLIAGSQLVLISNYECLPGAIYGLSLLAA
ncbi:MAG: hypothetical protein V9F03_14875, partial [Microthrixaceae bacterium]